jgi:hypothetical protein
MRPVGDPPAGRRATFRGMADTLRLMTTTEIEAEVVAGLLRDSGITATVAADAVLSARRPHMGGHTVLIRTQDEVRARAIIDETD